MFLWGQLPTEGRNTHLRMPKRPEQARVRAAVAAGDPPASCEHPDDGEWQRAQQDWLAKWSVRLLPDGPQRRRQWSNRKEEHARLVQTAARDMPPQKPKRTRARKPAKPIEREPVLAGPPQAKRVLPMSQPAYELAMGRYAVARDARRKLPRRTKAENAKRMRDERTLTAMMASSSLDGSAVAQERMDRERKRSKRRRVSQQPKASSFYEACLRRGRCDEQVALLKAIEDALPRSDALRREWDSAGSWDEPLCLAIMEWATSHTPDGSQEWEDALMTVSIQAATLRVTTGLRDTHRYRRVGALHTLRWLVHDLSFRVRPGALDPDPEMRIAQRAKEGYCVCGCRLPPSERLSSEDLELGGPPTEEQRDRGNGVVPFCRVHGVRKGPTPYPKRLYQRVDSVHVVA